MRTPYAILLVLPSDSAVTIRTRFHALSAVLHPDANDSNPATDDWYKVVEAYTVLKTDKSRFQWHKRQKLLSGLCAACSGSGVGRQKTTVVVCGVCGGEGRCLTSRA